MTRAIRVPVWASLLGVAALACGGPPVTPLPKTPDEPADVEAPAEPAPTPPKADPDLLPRALLFGNPDKAAPRISPDGKHLAFLAPRDGVLNVYVSKIDAIDAAKPVTDDKLRGVRRYFWAHSNRHVVYLQDQGGDENWRVYSVDVESGEKKDLTPIEGVNARIEAVSHKKPNQILVGLNDRDKKLHDVYEIDLKTGKRKLVEKNEQGFVGYVIDDNYRVKLALQFLPTGGVQYSKKQGKKWVEAFSHGPEDALTTEPRGFNAQGTRLYMVDSRGRDKSAFVSVDLRKNEAKVLAEDKKADIGEILLHPTKKTPQAVGVNFTKKEWKVLDKGIEADFAEIAKIGDGEIGIASRTLDDQHWIIALVDDDGPIRYHHWDRKAKKSKFLFSNRKALEDKPLAKMHPKVIRSRDGLELVSYLSLPPGSDEDGDAKPAAPVPMVLLVHGGPWGRDRWGYNPYHQWLASRGYAVLSVNFRGSTGFGKKFINAADKEWAGKMHDDLLDAVDWAVKAGVTPKDKVAIMGGSYGGYATLVGLTFTPEKFACGVDIVGPSNLITLLENIPPYWAPFLPILTTRVGDPKTPQGKQHLAARSPLTHSGKIVRPLLIAQGANDPRVKQQESDQIVEAMKANDIPVTYVLYPDEGHGFARPQNRLSFFAVTDVFLAQCLGGSYQPIGKDFEGSSIQVPEGATHVYGLDGALP